MDRSTLTEETLKAEANGDEAYLRRLAEADRSGRLHELTPKYGTGPGAGSGSSQYSGGGSGDPEQGGDLEQRIEEAARLNERVGAEDTAEALRRIQDAENPQSALQKAHRRARSVGDDYTAEEFENLLDD
jgi:hypothetical protein